VVEVVVVVVVGATGHARSTARPTDARRSMSASAAVTLPLSSTSHTHGSQGTSATTACSTKNASRTVILPSPDRSPQRLPATTAPAQASLRTETAATSASKQTGLAAAARANKSTATPPPPSAARMREARRMPGSSQLACHLAASEPAGNPTIATIGLSPPRIGPSGFPKIGRGGHPRCGTSRTRSVPTRLEPSPPGARSRAVPSVDAAAPIAESRDANQG